MNIISIKTFLTVVRIGHLNRAAIELNITQSAVTARLDALDDALGSRLLNRSRKGATMTKAGYAFLEQAEVMVHMWDTAKARISLPHGIKSLFSMVADPSLWQGLGNLWLDELRSTYADIAFEVWTARAHEAQGWLLSGVSDAALLPEPLSGAGIASRIFHRQRLVQVSTQARNRVTWDPHYVLVDYGTKFRADHAQAWPGEDSASMTFSNPEWAMNHILNHGGSAYLPVSMAAPYLESGKLHNVAGAPIFERTIYLNWRTSCDEQFVWLKQTF